MNATLRDVLEGKIQKRVVVQGLLPFAFENSEEVVWLFTRAQYAEDKTYRSYVGGYEGTSIQIMNGFYYQAGGFKGRSVESTSLEVVGEGPVAITTKNIYFACPQYAVKIPYTKLILLIPFEDGIGLIGEGVNSRRQVFITGKGTGWFIYNLAVNLPKMGFGKAVGTNN